MQTLGASKCGMDPRDEGVTVSLVMLASFCVGGELGFPGALPQRRVVWMWFGAFPGAFGRGELPFW